jgi:hypothetical protein
VVEPPFEDDDPVEAPLVPVPEEAPSPESSLEVELPAADPASSDVVEVGDSSVSSAGPLRDTGVNPNSVTSASPASAPPADEMSSAPIQNLSVR